MREDRPGDEPKAAIACNIAVFHKHRTPSNNMRYREGEEVDPDYPYTESTHMMMNLAYGMSIPIGLILLWLAIRGRILWLKVWSVGLMALGIGILIKQYLG